VTGAQRRVALGVVMATALAAPALAQGWSSPPSGYLAPPTRGALMPPAGSYNPDAPVTPWRGPPQGYGPRGHAPYGYLPYGHVERTPAPRHAPTVRQGQGVPALPPLR
jgi:hypothetical protein